MKMKNLLIGVMSVALVACISVGATLAYLSASDDAVTNTFQFANGITVNLTEPQPKTVANEEISGNAESGWNYTNVVPGQTLNKAPEFSVTTSVDTYVFAKVTPGENMVIGKIEQGWNMLDGVTGLEEGQKVYYQQVSGSAAEQALGALFTQVTVGNVKLSGSETLGDIKIQVAAIQAKGFGTVQAAYSEANFQ